MFVLCKHKDFSLFGSFACGFACSWVKLYAAFGEHIEYFKSLFRMENQVSKQCRLCSDAVQRGV